MGSGPGKPDSASGEGRDGVRPSGTRTQVASHVALGRLRPAWVQKFHLPAPSKPDLDAGVTERGTQVDSLGGLPTPAREGAGGQPPAPGWREGSGGM